VFNIENACASSAVALHLAHRAVVSGSIDCALVIGVDKLSELGKGTLPVQETEWDGQAGVTNPVVYALRAQRYMYETGASVEDLAVVSVKARRFADMNPRAHQSGTVTIEEVLASRPVADPLTLYQCSPKSDGAAAALLIAADVADSHGLAGPTVRASVVKSGRFSMAARDITRPDITTRAAEEAFQVAGLGPADLDVVELHDAFSIAELLYYEELGLCAEGAGAHFVTSGASSSLEAGTGILVNPSGGLIGRGHPIGATGVAQIVELTSQLMGQSGERQRAGARVGLAHVTGGGASGFDNGACAVTIMTAD
jgi:benzoylsuccinyl-CoA thiolase BbsB subunit